MRQYNKYLIKKTDQFDPYFFSSINDELDSIKEKTQHLPSTFKAEIIVSFLKDGSIQNEWVKANPQLTELVESGALFTGSIESLFASCRENPVFRQHLELYITKGLADSQSSMSKA